MNTKKIIFLVLIILVIGAGGWYGYGEYSDFVTLREMRKEADKFNVEQSRLKALIEADTYGGATPQETLQMFITAVEASDYELASKYFVVEKRGEWKKNLQEVKNVDFLINELLKINDRLTKGLLSYEDDNFIITDPIFLSFIKYPSGIWKINEI